MSRDAPTPPDPAVWQAQYLRLISFPVEPQNSVQQNWWHDLTGADRERRVEKKREVEEEGTFDGLSLSLSIDLLRLQWTVAPRLSAENLPDELPVLGQFLQRKDWFSNLMRRWLASSPPVSRLAFAGVLLQPVESPEAGNAMLDRYLRWVDIDPQCTDFLYRVNRHVRSRTDVPGLHVNRLMTWSVGRFTAFIREQLLGPAGQEAAQQIAKAEKYACVLELDINTAPGPADLVLRHEALPHILDELVELGVDIATKGDIRT
jgi:hypothetical protein